MAVTMQLKGVSSLVKSLQALAARYDGGVKVTGPATAYALVWEFGSARLSKPGPKTTWGVNPNGDTVILTLTAPNGFIRVNRQEYIKILREEFNRVSWSKIPIVEWGAQAKAVVEEASIRCALLIRDTAPEDTGQLKDAIEPVAGDDPILAAGHTTQLEIGTGWL